MDWISVNERLPKRKGKELYSETVIVHHEDGDIGTGNYFFEEKEWDGGYRPTHWMPKPPPPTTYLKPKNTEVIELNGFKYQIEREREIEINGWCFEIHKEYPSHKPRFPDKNKEYSWYLRQLNMGYRKQSPALALSRQGFEPHKIMDGSCIKIVGSDDPSLNLPLILKK